MHDRAEIQIKYSFCDSAELPAKFHPSATY